MRSIFCGNFEYDARQSDLERLFKKYGKVDRVDMKSGKFWCWFYLFVFGQQVYVTLIASFSIYFGVIICFLNDLCSFHLRFMDTIFFLRKYDKSLKL